MTTLFDLDVLSVRPGQGSFAAATSAYEIRDAQDTVVGLVGQRSGSAVAVLRRHLTHYAYRTPATFDVTDVAGNVQLVIERRRASALSTGVDVKALLADGTPVARCAGGGGIAQGFTCSDPAGSVFAQVARAEGLDHVVTEPDGRPLADITHLPVTRSVVHPDGRTTPAWEIEFRAEAATRVRVATLATVIALDSSR